MKILFIGSVLFSQYALEKLISMNENIVGIITKNSSSFNSDFVDLSFLAKKHNIPYFYTKDINSEEAEKFIKKLNPDVSYCFGWSQLLKRNILEIPKLGVIGFHPSKLPQNRGRHPIIWALFLGLEETASTFFIMDENADSGNIISRKIVKIKYEDDAMSLYKKITKVALTQIEEFTQQLKEGKLQKIKQDTKNSNYWRKRSFEDGIIDFRMSSYAIYNLVRALTKTYIGAEVQYRGKYYKVWKVKEEKVNLPNIEPGKVLDVKDKNILVKCYDNAIWLNEHEITSLPKIGEYLL